MKLRRSQPTDLTPYIYRVGEEVSRENFPDERQFEAPLSPEENSRGWENLVAETRSHQSELEPLFNYEQPTRRQISYVLAGCCVMVLLVLLVFAWTR